MLNNEDVTSASKKDEGPIVIVIEVKKPRWLLDIENSYLLWGKKVPEFNLFKRGSFWGGPCGRSCH